MPWYMLSLSLALSPILASRSTGTFVEFQALRTYFGRDCETVIIDGTHYLAVANGGNQSMIYRWEGSTFVEFQSVLTDSASDWEAFYINDVAFLVLANLGVSSPVNRSKVYRWNGLSFEEVQQILTFGAVTWKSFCINGAQHLVVANYKDAVGFDNIESKVYRWDGLLFAEIQSIPTFRAIDVEAFHVDDTPYIAFAVPGQLPSNVYRWNGTSFAHFQAIPAAQGHGVKSFDILGTPYLAVADTGIDATSSIMRWNGSSFIEVQGVTSFRAKSWEAFNLGGVPYLALAISEGATGVYNTSSKVFRWEGSGFVEHQFVPTNVALQFHAFSIGGMSSLAVASLGAQLHHVGIDMHLDHRKRDEHGIMDDHNELGVRNDIGRGDHDDRQQHVGIDIHLDHR